MRKWASLLPQLVEDRILMAEHERQENDIFLSFIPEEYAASTMLRIPLINILTTLMSR